MYVPTLQVYTCTLRYLLHQQGPKDQKKRKGLCILKFGPIATRVTEMSTYVVFRCCTRDEIVTISVEFAAKDSS